MSDAPRQLPPKKEVALALLEGSSLFVHLDPRRVGVTVPKWFTAQPQLVLQVGLNMAIPIHDLKVDDEGVSCTLSFNRSPFCCILPWSAIYALVGEDGRGMVWPDDVPPEVAVQQQQPASAPKAVPSKKSRAKLAAVEPSRDEEAPPRKRVREEPKAAEKEPKRLLEAVSSPRAPRPPDLRSEDPDEKSAPPSPAGAPPNGAGKKPKRELPPYLRVIK